MGSGEHLAESAGREEAWDPVAHQARLDKYGSTLDRWNVNYVAARIADYPELIAAVDALRECSNPPASSEPCEYVPSSTYNGTPVYQRWAACRPCGWRGPVQTHWSVAEQDFAKHQAERRTSPAKPDAS